MHNDIRSWKNVCVIYVLVVKGEEVKELKFRTAVSGISRRGVWVYYLSRLVGRVLEFVWYKANFILYPILDRQEMKIFQLGGNMGKRMSANPAQ